MDSEPLPPLPAEPSPRRKLELYQSVGVKTRPPPPMRGTDRKVVPSVLPEDVEGINSLIAREAAEFREARRAKAEVEKAAREQAAVEATVKQQRARVDSARTIALDPALPRGMAEFLATRDDSGNLTRFEVRQAMHEHVSNSLATRNLLTTEKKKVLRSRHYPILRQEPQRDAPSADEPIAPGESVRLWQKKLGLPAADV